MPVVEGRISERTGNVSVLRDTGCSGESLGEACALKIALPGKQEHVS